MDFGRDVDIHQIDFKLPHLPDSIKKVLGGTKVAKLQVYIGGVLWSDASFVDTIYPASAKAKDYARHYCKQFNTIELNTTHYRLPEKERLLKWAKDAPEQFRFCPKVPQAISHSGNLNSMLAFTKEFHEHILQFTNRLGLSFLQLPPHFAPNRLNELLDFLDHSPIREMAIEVRHPEWFAESKAFNELCNYLYKNKMPIVITDTAGRRDVLHMRFTSKSTLIRFNANNRHTTDYERINAWIEHIKQLIENGIETIYFFVHTPQQIHMPYLATYFIQQLKRECGVQLAPPKIKEDTGFTGKLF
jgi:uncharacterized protein YecE (DUF72 family)